MTDDELNRLRTEVKAWRELTAELSNHEAQLESLKSNIKLDEQVRNELLLKHQNAVTSLRKRLAEIGGDPVAQDKRCRAAEAARTAVHVTKTVKDWLSDSRNPLLLTAGPMKPLPIHTIDPDFFAKIRKQVLEWATAEYAQQQESFNKL